MSKGGDVSEVEEVTGADRTQDWTLDLRVRSVLCSEGLSLDV